MSVLKIPGSRAEQFPMLADLIDGSLKTFIDCQAGDLSTTCNMIDVFNRFDYIVNDPNFFVSEFYKLVRTSNRHLGSLFDSIISLQEFKRHSRILDYYNLDEFASDELAAALLYCNKCSFNRILRWNKVGKFTSPFNGKLEGRSSSQIFNQNFWSKLTDLHYQLRNISNITSKVLISYIEELNTTNSIIYINISNAEHMWPKAEAYLNNASSLKPKRYRTFTTKPQTIDDHIKLMHIAYALMSSNNQVLIPSTPNAFTIDLYTNFASNWDFKFNIIHPHKSSKSSDIIITGY